MPRTYLGYTQTAANADLDALAAGTASASWIQAGSGAVSRTMSAKLREQISVLDFGATGNGVTDDTTSVLAAIVEADGGPVLVPEGTYIIDNLVLSSVDAWLVGPGVLKHKAASTNYMIFQTGPSATFLAQGVTFDGNRTNQSTRTTMLYFDGTLDVQMRGCKVKSSYAAAFELHGALGFVTVEGNAFTDMAEHGGVFNQTSFVGYIVGTTAEHIAVRNNRVIGNVPVNPDLNGAGFFVSMAGAAPCDFTGNYFENIGQRFSGNPSGCIDLYTNGMQCTVTGNRVKNGYYNPFKLQIADKLLCAFNRVDGLVDSDALIGYTVMQYARAFGSVIDHALIFGNFLDQGSATDIIAFYCAGDNAYHTDALLLKDNHVTSAGQLLLLDRVKFAELDGNMADGITGMSAGTNAAIVVANTDQGAGAPTKATVRVRGGRINGSAAIGIFARTNVTNLDIDVVGVQFPDWLNANAAVTVRDAKSARIIGCEFAKATTQLDLQNLDYAQVDGNRGITTGTLSLSTGINSLDYGFNPAWDLAGATTFNPGAISAGAQEVTTLTVTGVGTGTHDVPADKIKFSESLQGLSLTAWVSGANTVSVCFFNPTSGSINLSSGTLSVLAIRRVAFDT